MWTVSGKFVRSGVKLAHAAGSATWLLWEWEWFVREFVWILYCVWKSIHHSGCSHSFWKTVLLVLVCIVLHFSCCCLPWNKIIACWWYSALNYEKETKIQAESLMCNSLTLTVSCNTRVITECYSVLLLKQYTVCCTITCCWPHVLSYVFIFAFAVRFKKIQNTQSVSWRECCFCKVFVKKNSIYILIYVFNFQCCSLDIAFL